MLIEVYTTKIVAKLKPINAANPWSISNAWLRVILCMLKPIAKIATKGAKITIHFITPVKKNAINAGLELTR